MNSFIIFIRKINYTSLSKDAICCVAVTQTSRGERGTNKGIEIPKNIASKKLKLGIYFLDLQKLASIKVNLK